MVKPSRTRQDIHHAQLVRAVALDDAGRPTGRMVWAHERVALGVPTPPLLLTVDHVVLAAGTAMEVSLSRVVDRALRELIAEVCPRPGQRITEAGPSLHLDVWEQEQDTWARSQGYYVRHWLLPRLVLQRTDSFVGGLRVLIDDGDGHGEVVPDKFAGGLAIEHPANAATHQLWWPREAPAPVRAYQWWRERDVPPVPV